MDNFGHDTVEFLHMLVDDGPAVTHGRSDHLMHTDIGNISFVVHLVDGGDELTDLGDRRARFCCYGGTSLLDLVHESKCDGFVYLLL